MEVAGAKYVYAQRKQELKLVLKHPVDNDADLVSSQSLHHPPVLS